MEVDLGTATQRAPLLLTTWAPAIKDFGASSVSEVANSTAPSGDSAVGLFADDALPSSGTLAEVSKELRITLYILIFVADVLGNSLVIATLAQNKHMRTVTNMFLLNLAISDLLLGVFCMPFTLIGSVLRDFIFGEAMCKIIPYVQEVKEIGKIPKIEISNGQSENPTKQETLQNLLLRYTFKMLKQVSTHIAPTEVVTSGAVEVMSTTQSFN